MYKANTKIFIFIALLILSIKGFSQSILYPGAPKIIHFSHEDYNGNPQSWNFIQDQRGFLYNANTEGIIIFDGQSWQILKPYGSSVIRCLTKDKYGKIYAGGYNKIFYLTSDSNGNFLLKNIKYLEKYNFGNIWNLIYANKHLLIKSDSSISLYDLKNEKLFLITNNTNLYPDKVYNNIFLYGRKQPIYKVDFINRKLVTSSLTDILLSNKNIRVLALFPAFEDKIFVIRNDSLILLDKNYNILKKKKNISNAPLYAYSANKDFAFINYRGQGVYVYDKNLNLVNIFTKKSGLGSNSINDIYIDTYNNVWLAGDYGLDYVILNSPLSYLDKRFGIDLSRGNTFFNNKFHFLSPRSVNYLPNNILFNPTKTYKQFTKIIDGQSWNFLQLKNSLLISHNPGIIQLFKHSKNYLNYLNNINVWKIEKIPNSNFLFIGTAKGGYIAQYDEKEILKNFQKVIDGDIKYFTIDKKNNLWASVILDSAAFIKAKIYYEPTPKLKIEKIFSKEDSVYFLYDIIPFYDKNKDLVIINDGSIIKYFDTTINKFVEFTEISKQFKHKKHELYLIYIDERENYWINYVNKSLPIHSRYKIYLFKNKGKHLNFSPLLTQAVTFGDFYIGGSTYNKRFVFLNTTKGILIFDYNNKIDSSKYHFNIYIRKILATKNNDTIWYGNTPDKYGKLTSIPPNDLKIKYKDNGIIFYFAAPFFENSNDIEFSYKLEGLDKSWSAWTNRNYKEYPFLREGEYILRVRAKNIYGVYSPELSYSFRVLPPWYRTTLAYIFYILAILAMIVTGIKLYTKALRKRNERLEQIVRDRTKEIEMKNAELEQQKEEILTQADELAEINKELEKLSLIVEKTDNAVLLTDKDGNFIWVNPGFTRIFGYTLDELKTQISYNIVGENTDPRIKEIINKCKTEKITVEYDTSFKTKDGREIWVHSTLTPVLDEAGNIVNLIAIDSDITKLKEAEEKIKIQNENIKGSIRYAQVIQKSILPLKEEFDKFFESFILYLPRDIVSGDFYWISNLFFDINKAHHCLSKHKYFKPGEYFFISVIDCTGHGVPGAFMSIIGNRLLDNLINQNNIHNPAEVFNKMDDRLSEIFRHTQESHRDGMSGSLCRFDKICQEEQSVIKVTFAGAKGNILIYRKNDNKLINLKGIRRAIGQPIYKEIEFENQVFYLQEGDIIFLYTDGYKDQNNAQRHRLGTKRFQKIIMDNINLPMEELKEKLEAFLKEWMKDTDQRDDITVIGLKITSL